MLWLIGVYLGHITQPYFVVINLYNCFGLVEKQHPFFSDTWSISLRSNMKMIWTIFPTLSLKLAGPWRSLPFYGSKFNQTELFVGLVKAGSIHEYVLHPSLLKWMGNEFRCDRILTQKHMTSHERTTPFMVCFKLYLWPLYVNSIWSGGNSTYGREEIPNMAGRKLHIWPVPVE